MNAVDVFQDWLNQYLNFEHNPKKGIFWLETIKFLCERFGNPEQSFKSFHIAGSKGKGSVSRMISCILEQNGFKTGVYSSPHITDFRERISKPQAFLEESVYEKSVKEIVPKIESLLPEQMPGERPVTWFELVTLFAFLCFRNAGMDYGVFEVGLGGRLDATNIIIPEICCVNVIELEHTEYLGDTLEKIAMEKAGIIKAGIPVLVANQLSDSVNEVFKKVCKEKNAPLFFVKDLINSLEYSYSELGLMKIHIESSVFNRPLDTMIPLLGKMQAENACMAALAIKLTHPEIDEKIIEKGLSHAVLPGRFEVMHNVHSFENVKTMILDGAHTVHSIALTLETMEKIFSGKKINLLFACAADKDISEIAPLLKNKFFHVFITKPGIIKECNLKAVMEAFNKAGIDYICEDDFSKFIPKVMKQTSKDDAILLVTGSFYLVSEVKKTLGIWN